MLPFPYTQQSEKNMIYKIVKKKPKKTLISRKKNCSAICFVYRDAQRQEVQLRRSSNHNKVPVKVLSATSNLAEPSTFLFLGGFLCMIILMFAGILGEDFVWSCFV